MITWKRNTDSIVNKSLTQPVPEVIKCWAARPKVLVYGYFWTESLSIFYFLTVAHTEMPSISNGIVATIENKQFVG